MKPASDSYESAGEKIDRLFGTGQPKLNISCSEAKLFPAPAGGDERFTIEECRAGYRVLTPEASDGQGE